MNIKRIIREEMEDLDWIKNISDKWEPNIGDRFICKPVFHRQYGTTALFRWGSDDYGGAAYVEGKIYTISDISKNYDNDDNTIFFTEEDPNHNGVYKKAAEPYV